MLTSFEKHKRMIPHIKTSFDGHVEDPLRCFKDQLKMCWTKLVQILNSGIDLFMRIVLFFAYSVYIELSIVSLGANLWNLPLEQL